MGGLAKYKLQGLVMECKEVEQVLGKYVYLIIKEGRCIMASVARYWRSETVLQCWGLAKKWGLTSEFLTWYKRFRKDGYTPTQAAMEAAAEWDLF